MRPMRLIYSVMRTVSRTNSGGMNLAEFWFRWQLGWLTSIIQPRRQCSKDNDSEKETRGFHTDARWWMESLVRVSLHGPARPF